MRKDVPCTPEPKRIKIGNGGKDVEEENEFHDDDVSTTAFTAKGECQLKQLDEGALIQLALIVQTFAVTEDESTRLDVLDAFGKSGDLLTEFFKVYEPLDKGTAKQLEDCSANGSPTKHIVGAFSSLKRVKGNVNLNDVKREIGILLDISACASCNSLFLVWEPCAARIAVLLEGSLPIDVLFQVLQNGPVREVLARPLFQGILRALAYIHGHDLIHRDVKAENILLKALDAPLLADFGLTAAISDREEMRRRCGSPGYVAPEICLGKPYGPKVDVFAAGVVLYFMLSKQLPFRCPDGSLKETLRKTVKCHLHLSKPPFQGSSALLRGLLRALVCKDQNARLNAFVASTHAWFGGES